MSQEIVFQKMQEINKPIKAGELAELTGIDKKEIEKIIKKLVKEGKIDSPIRCFYAVKK